MNLDSIPRVHLTSLPTPLEPAPRLASQLGLRKLLIKRDDCTTLAGGGNKARKLEYLMADALRRNADVVLTDGGPQSNHARMTAGAARKLGIDECILFLGGPRFDRFDGNLLLDVVLGAEIRFMENATVKDMEDEMQAEAARLSAQGRNPYVIPIGGSTPLGSLGYVNGIRELVGQLDDDDRAPVIYVPVGSAGTMAGCALGVRLFLPEAQLVGISVARKSRPLRQIAAKNATQAAALIGVDEVFSPDDLTINDEYYGEFYGVPTDGGNRAILAAARTEGLILDPVYTGKAMFGLMELVAKESADRERTVVFIHTGGSPSLHAFEEHFRAMARYEAIEY